MYSKTKIAGSFTVQDWLDIRDNLSFSDDKLWSLAYSIFEVRLKSRFLEPIDRIKKQDLNSGEGFSIALIGVVLLEVLAAVHFGKRYKVQDSNNKKPLSPYEYSSSAQLLKELFEKSDIFKNRVDEASFKKHFYEEIRCGLVHEARTKGDSIVKSNRTEKDDSELFYYKKDNLPIFHRDNFLDALHTYLDWHKSEILDKSNRELRLNFYLKMDDICEIDHVWYFVYGSNLLKSKFNERLVDIGARYYKALPAILNGYKFVYNKKKKDGSSAANLVRAEDIAYGVAFLLDKKALNDFARFEKGYSQKPIIIESLKDKMEIPSRTFISESFTEAKPNKEYVSEVVEGAKEWEIDSDYINTFLKQ